MLIGLGIAVALGALWLEHLSIERVRHRLEEIATSKSGESGGNHTRELLALLKNAEERIKRIEEIEAASLPSPPR